MEKSPREQASPAKKRRSSTGAASARAAIRFPRQGIGIGAARERIRAPAMDVQRLDAAPRNRCRAGRRAPPRRSRRRRPRPPPRARRPAGRRNKPRSWAARTGGNGRCPCRRGRCGRRAGCPLSNSSGSASERKSFVASPSGRPAAASVFSGRAGAKSSLSSARSALGSVTMAASAAMVPCAVSMFKRRPPMIDPQHRAVERDRHIRGMRDDGRAVAFDHAPVHAAVVVAGEIRAPRRDRARRR